VLQQHDLEICKVHQMLELENRSPEIYEKSIFVYWHQCNSAVERIRDIRQLNHYVPLRAKILENANIDHDVWVDEYNQLIRARKSMKQKIKVKSSKLRRNIK
jgi:hypothetical protein